MPQSWKWKPAGAKALLLTGQIQAAFVALNDAGQRFPRSVAIQDLQRKVATAMRLHGRSRGLVSGKAIALAGRLYERTR